MCVHMSGILVNGAFRGFAVSELRSAAKEHGPVRVFWDAAASQVACRILNVLNVRARTKETLVADCESLAPYQVSSVNPANGPVSGVFARYLAS